MYIAGNFRICCILLLLQCSPPENYDILIKGGTLIDGTSAERIEKGFIHVLVNGEFVLKDEKITGALPGIFLKRER